MTNRYRRVALSLLGIFGCVLAVDVSLRALAPFELHRDWEHPLIAAKEELYAKFAERGVDVLIVGSSLAMNLDAKRISKLSKHRVFNGSIAGLTAAGIGAVMQEAYAPLHNPKLVIYPLSMRDIREHDNAFDMPPFPSHKMRAARPTSWQGRLEIAAEKVSYLFRIRRQLRHALVSEEQEQRTISPDAYGARRHAPHMLEKRLRNKGYAKKTYQKLQREGEASADTVNARELLEMLEVNRSRGVQTVLVNMTISKAALSGELEGRYVRYMAELKALAEKADVPLYDALGDLDLDNGYFNDFVHVGARGDEKVEDYLVDVIERHLSAP